MADIESTTTLVTNGGDDGKVSFNSTLWRIRLLLLPHKSKNGIAIADIESATTLVTNGEKVNFNSTLVPLAKSHNANVKSVLPQLQTA
jgi:hypothetical protein